VNEPWEESQAQEEPEEYHRSDSDGSVRPKSPKAGEEEIVKENAYEEDNINEWVAVPASLCIAGLTRQKWKDKYFANLEVRAVYLSGRSFGLRARKERNPLSIHAGALPSCQGRLAGKMKRLGASVGQDQ
jgi:hypothetical protein